MTFPITVCNVLVFASTALFAAWVLYRFLCFLWPPGGYGLDNLDVDIDVQFQHVPNDVERRRGGAAFDRAVALLDARGEEPKEP